MPTDPLDKTESGEHVHWGVVLTNAIGMIVGLALTASVTGVVYLAWTVPSSQLRILENQLLLRERFDKLEAAGQDREARINRLEALNEK